jgi:hypothetical protein
MVGGGVLSDQGIWLMASFRKESVTGLKPKIIQKLWPMWLLVLKVPRFIKLSMMTGFDHAG